MTQLAWWSPEIRLHLLRRAHINESHLAHLSESASELSDSTICEIECFHFEGMSDTPLELRELVDRSSEAISISNNLPSTSSVFTHVVLGPMDDETPSFDLMVPLIEKMYMEDEDDATPCLHAQITQNVFSQRIFLC